MINFIPAKEETGYEVRIKRHEGLRLKPYRCSAGKLTIGYGRNLDEIGISEDEAEYLLQKDLYRVVSELTRSIPIFNDLGFNRRYVLIDMCFNLGLPKLLGFKKMWKALYVEDYQLAAKEMLDSRWARQVGDRAVRLADAMLTDLWPDENTTNQ